MSKIGLTVLRKDNATDLSSHFGVAKWVLVYDTDSGEMVFVQNQGLTGRAVVDTLVQCGCADVIFSSIGDGAFAHLEEAGIRGWYGPQNKPPAELAELLQHGKLRRAESASHTAPQRRRGRKR